MELGSRLDDPKSKFRDRFYRRDTLSFDLGTGTGQMDQKSSSRAILFNMIKHGVLLIVSLLFLFFGIQVLHFAYRLKDPFAFVMTFFASNLMILISAALALGFALKLIKSRQAGLSRRQSRSTPDDSSPADAS